MPDIGEQRFARWLDARGVDWLGEDQLVEAPALQPALAETPRRPDFYVPGVLLAEVKTLQDFTDALQGDAVDYSVVMKRLQRAVDTAKKQLAGFAGLGLPLLVVLDTARQHEVPLAVEDLVQLYGRLATGDGAVYSLRGGRRTVSAGSAHLSALCLLEGPDNAPTLAVVHHPAATVPWPAGALLGAGDCAYVCREDEWRNAATDALLF